MAAITLRSLMECFNRENSKILTGKDNLNGVVRWVHMVESVEISSFLEGQEIAFITGAALKSEDDLFEIVKSIIENQATAIIINIGPYIKRIPDKVLQYCEKRQFPLITVPWKTHMAHIMQIICYKITEIGKANMELSSAVKNAIFFPAQKELYIPALERYNYSPEWSYCVSVIEILHGVQPMEEKARERIRNYIENQLSYEFKDLIIFELDKKILLIFHNLTDNEVKKVLDLVIRNYSSMLGKDEKSFVGIGKSTKSMKCISKSYEQAMGVLKLQKRRNESERAVTYSSLGLYKLILAMNDKEVQREYYMETMGVLLKYDETAHTDYCKVLECYLKHSGSVKDTADELFVHRNTINNKVNKIEEITGYNLSNLDTRVRFKIALMIQEIL